MPRWIVIVRGRLHERLKGALNEAGMDTLARHHSGLGQDRYTQGFAVGVEAETPEQASVKLDALLSEGYEIQNVLRPDDD